VGGQSVAFHDGPWVDFVGDKHFGFAEEFCCKDCDGGGAVAYFIVLHF
jgi:hypothetical protein